MPVRKRKPKEPINLYEVKDKILVADVVAAAVAQHTATPGSSAWEAATARLAKAAIRLRAWRRANDRDEISGSPLRDRTG